MVLKKVRMYDYSKNLHADYDGGNGQGNAIKSPGLEPL